MPVEEARLVETESGLEPDGSGWFVVNVRDAAWYGSEAFASAALWRGPDISPQLGVAVGVLEPGKPNCMYHEESQQEAFLVIAGECLLVVEGEERRLKAWDFFHCPPGTRHVFVGAGEGPCVVVAIGARQDGAEVLFPADEVARRHGASVERDTRDGSEAYAGYPAYERVRPPAGLPWDTEPPAGAAR